MRSGHFYLVSRSFFAGLCSFLQDDPLVPGKLPALSLWVVLRFMRFVLWYRGCLGDGWASTDRVPWYLFFVIGGVIVA